jgi:hypothetical protein
MLLLSPSNSLCLVLLFFFFLFFVEMVLIYYLSIATYRQKDSLDDEDNVYSYTYRHDLFVSFLWHWLIDDDNCPFTDKVRCCCTAAFHVNTTHESNQKWCYAPRKMRDNKRVIMCDQTWRCSCFFIHLNGPNFR